MTEIDLAIAILFYNKIDQTIECLKSLLPSGAKIYVLNNDSAASARLELGKFCHSYAQVTIFDSDTNLGVAVGRNYLVTHTGEEWIFFVDNDIVVRTSDWMSNFIRNVYLYKDFEVLAPKLFNAYTEKYALYKTMEIKWRRAFYNPVVIDDSTNYFQGGASFVYRGLFDRLGLYDEKMFTGFEDSELCIRAILRGNPVKVRLIHDIELVHNHCYTQKDEDRASVITRYNISTIEASFNRIIEKHNVVLEGDWKRWVNDVKTLMLEKETIPPGESHREHRLIALARRILKPMPKPIYDMFRRGWYLLRSVKSS